MRPLRRLSLLLVLLAAACGEEGSATEPDARLPDATALTQPACNPVVGDDCVTPFPSSFHLEAADTETGVAIAIPDDVLPRSSAGVVIRPDRLNGKDGFSPATPFL